MSDFRADLHMHTTCSDGTSTPVELVKLASAAGLSGISITDHDSISAYETALPEAKRLGIRMGSGVEFSCHYRGMSVHILGYDFPLDAEQMHIYCAQHKERRHGRNREILKKLAHHRMEIDQDALELLEAQGGTVGRPHIAKLMIERGYVRNMAEAFKMYLSEGAICYSPGEQFPVDKAIELIHRVGGKAFIAHPHIIKSRKLIRGILKLPFDGIEAYYGRFHPLQEKKWVDVAMEKQWLVSGGSDFHGANKLNNVLGSSWVSQERFEEIFSKHEL